MGICIDVIVKNTFNECKDPVATYKKLAEVTGLLNANPNADDFRIVRYDVAEEWAIEDVSFQSEIAGIELYDGMWLIKTGWKMSQYLMECDNGTIRDSVKKYVHLLGGTEAYVCSAYSYTGLSDVWEADICFEDWLQKCEQKLGHKVEVYDINKALKNFRYLNGDSIYLDRFD